MALATASSVEELQALSLNRDQKLDSCVGNSSASCVKARTDLRIAAAKYLDAALTGNGESDEMSLLDRHMVFLDAWKYADSTDPVTGKDFDDATSTLKSDAAKALLTGSQQEIASIIRDPIIGGAIAWGGTGNAKTIIGESAGTGSTGTKGGGTAGQTAESTADGTGLSTATTNSTVKQADLDTLAANGVKFTPQNVVAAGTTTSGQIVFLETGNSSAGLLHIIEGHANDFANIGVSENQIPSVVMQAVAEGNIVGYQGSGIGRPIYQTTINGQPQRIAVTIGSNGFIVGANPAGSVK